MNKQVEGLIIGTLIIILTLLLGLLFPAPGAAAPPPVAFASAVNYAVGTNPYAVTSGDFNGDGKLDLAAANSVDGTVSVLLGNGDGKSDLAITDYYNAGVSNWLGKGDGSFT